MGIIPQTFFLTVTNPGAILGMAAMIGGLGSLIGGLNTYPEALLLVASVMGGSLLWWLGLAELIATIRHKLTEARLKLINRIAGAVLFAFGLILLLDGLVLRSAFLAALLRGALERELAMVNATGQAARHFRDRVLPIDVDEIGKRGKQSGVGEHFRLDAVVQGVFPGIEDVSKRRLLLRLVFRGSRRLPYRPQLWRPLVAGGHRETSQFTPPVHRRED